MISNISGNWTLTRVQVANQTIQTAKTLGLTVPPTLLAIVDESIE